MKNAFYYTHEEGVETLRKEHEAALIENDSIDVFELMGDLIEAGDQEAIDYLVGLMMIKNPIEDVNFSDSNEKIQSAKRIYYYDESDESKFEKKDVNGETIFSLPTMFVTIEAQKQKQNAKLSSSDYDTHILKEVLTVYFNAGQSELEKKYHPELDKILDELKDHPNFGVEISGYASVEGEEEYNEKLSNQRAISVLDYLNHRGIVRRRIIAKGYGATENEGITKEESRRVEVRVVDLNKI